MSLKAGDRLGPYEIVKLIGAGGMGEVYRARDTRLDRMVAIKVLPPGFTDDADRVRRFEQEARAAGGLNHPNILSVHDLGKHDGTLYVVTELLEGETLGARITSAPVPVRKAIDYTIQIARGLAAAHAKGITHRDIKPENLFLTSDGSVKILDFGLAKVALPKSEDKTSTRTAPAQTDPHAVMGTVGYMSPEQVRGTTVDNRSDIFSLGTVLYEMLAGKRAFARDSSVETMNAILKEDPPELPETVPPALDRIMRRCVEKKPEERFESAHDLAFALESISGGSGRARPVEPPRPSRRWFMAIAAATAAIVLLLLAFMIGRNGSRVAFPHFHRVTFRRGLIASANFANDGKTIIYSAAWDGKRYELFSTQETGPESRPLGIANAYPMSISRNGEMALILGPIVRLGETAGTLARVPVSGGAPREVAEDVFWADWSPDGSQLAVVRGAASGQVVEYPIGKKVYETGGFIGALKISPRGDLLALVDSPLTAEVGGYLVLIDRNGSRKAISRRWAGLAGLGWSPDGSEVWFCGTQRGIGTSLYAMDLRGHDKLLVPLPGLFFLMDTAPDGRALLSQIYLSSSAFFRAAGARQETDLYWHDESIVADISPDRSQILFSEGGDAIGTDLDTYVRKADGSPAVRLGEGLATAFSPDGRWAMANPNTQPEQLIAYPLGAGDSKRLTSDAIRHLAGRWLPDGKRIVFVGAEPGHHLRYYVQDSMQSPPRPISEEGVPFDRNVDDIVISPDGRSVAAVSDRGIQILAINGGRARLVPGVSPGFSPAAWCRDNSLLAYRSGEVPTRIVRVNLQSGEQRPWKELAPADRTGSFSLQPVRISSDCETYAYSVLYQPGTLFVVSGLR